MSQRTDVTSSVRTQQIRFMNPDWTYPTRGAVLAVADNVGSVVPTMDLTIASLSLKGVTGSVGELTYDGTNLLVNGEPITATTGDMSGDTIRLGQLVLTASGDYIRVKSETAEYVIRPGGGGGGGSGATGSVGPRGATGMTGPAGRPGPVGATGSPGLLGPTGPAGVAGVMGATGVTGPAGSVGPRGASGLQGIMGPTGAAGLGVTGAAGGPGPIGPTGLRGIAGVTGPTGPIGAMQPAGTPGTYLSPTSITTNVYGQVTDISGVGHSIANGTYAYPTSITTEGGYVKAIAASTNVVATVAGTDGIGVTGGTGRNPLISLVPAGPGAATYTSPTSLTLDAYGRVMGVSTSGATTLSSVVVTTDGAWKEPSIRWAADSSAGLYYLGPGGVAMCSSAVPVCYINPTGFHVEGGNVNFHGFAPTGYPTPTVQVAAAISGQSNGVIDIPTSILNISGLYSIELYDSAHVDFSTVIIGTVVSGKFRGGGAHISGNNIPNGYINITTEGSGTRLMIRNNTTFSINYTSSIRILAAF